MRAAYILIIAFTISGCSSEKIQINRTEFGEKWPFTVDAGYLECKDSALVFYHEGIGYGVNGVAKQKGFKDIEGIWRNAEYSMDVLQTAAKAEKITLEEAKIRLGSPGKINMAPIFEKGRSLCSENK